MSDYKVPLRDIAFSMNEVNDYGSHYLSYGGEIADSPELVAPIIEEVAKFVERVLAPINASGDREGAQWRDGKVTLPAGFKEARQQFVDAGWPSLMHPKEHGGQGVPSSLGIILGEFYQAANSAWCMTGLGSGVASTLINMGSEHQQQCYLPRLVSGEWTGTMNLTESHCGSDLGLMRTRAEPQPDGSYRISGSKIFISSGDHDLSDNIIHMVLARLPDAPEGIRGISLFLVPKRAVRDDGSLGDFNNVSCGSIEHKMGLHASATCVMNFDGAVGELVGSANKGLLGMFIMINQSRLGVGITGVAQSEACYQSALHYAQDRLQGRALTGPRNPELAADPIIVHLDVRRMLLTQKAFAEGGRVFIHYCLKYMDMANSDNAEVRDNADNMLALLTPIAKACLSEWGFEAADLAIQVLGGHGYVREWGVEQRLRDVRVARIYEGTNGIQALDLLGRKVLGPQRGALQAFIEEITEFCDEHADIDELAGFLARLGEHALLWREATDDISAQASVDPDVIGAAAFDYLMFSGYTTLAYMWVKAAVVAVQKLANSEDEGAFYRGKINTCRFYFDRLLPRARGHLEVVKNGGESLMAADSDSFA